MERPIRPQVERRKGVSLIHQPASTKRARLKWSKQDVANFVADVKNIDPFER